MKGPPTNNTPNCLTSLTVQGAGYLTWKSVIIEPIDVIIDPFCRSLMRIFCNCNPVFLHEDSQLWTSWTHTLSIPFSL